MSEYWVEENIRPRSHQDSDRLLIDDLEPIINVLKQKGIISWHFLREDSNWRGSQNIRHIRLRFRAKISYCVLVNICADLTLNNLFPKIVNAQWIAKAMTIESMKLRRP